VLGANIFDLIQSVFLAAQAAFETEYVIHKGLLETFQVFET
jgi:hypothetical protein